MTLHISTRDCQDLRCQAEEAYPNECCGVLVGNIADGERHVQSLIPCRNVRASDAHKRYEIDPAELVRVQREARERGMEILGFYHSHPDHPAQPSPTDLEHAHWIGCSYVITSVVEGKAAETRSFFVSGTQEEDKKFIDELFAIEPEPDSSVPQFKVDRD